MDLSRLVIGMIPLYFLVIIVIIRHLHDNRGFYLYLINYWMYMPGWMIWRWLFHPIREYKRQWKIYHTLSTLLVDLLPFVIELAFLHIIFQTLYDALMKGCEEQQSISKPNTIG